MIEVNVTEFRRHFGKYFNFIVEKKEEIHLIKYGKWVATLRPYNKLN